MGDVQFDDEQQHFTSHRILGENVQPKMVRTLTKMGLVKNEKQAGALLIIIMILCFGISLYLFGNLFGWFTPPADEYIPTDAEMML